MNDYFISTEETLLNPERIWFLLKDCYWCKNIPIEYVKKFIKYSLCFGVYQSHTNYLVGFGRVITDYTTYAYVCDIVIDIKYRKIGLANALFSAIKNHSDLQGLKTWALRTSPEAKTIYERYGFKIILDPETQLEINDLEIYCYPDFVKVLEG